MKTPIKLLLKFFFIITILHSQPGYTAMPDDLSLNRWKCGLAPSRPISARMQEAFQGEFEENLFRDSDGSQRAAIEGAVGKPGIDRPLTIRQTSVIVTPEMSPLERLKAVRAILLLPEPARAAILFGTIDFMRDINTWDKRKQILFHCLVHEGARNLNRVVKMAMGRTFSRMPEGSSISDLSDILQLASRNSVVGEFLAFVETNRITAVETMAVIAQIPNSDLWADKLIEFSS